MASEDRTIFSGMSIYLDKKWMDNHALIIEDGVFKALITAEMVKHHLPARHYTFDATHRMLPGLIDLHVHGADNADVMDGSVEALQKISVALAREGCTGFLATTMTAKKSVLNDVLPVIAEASEKVTGAAILGVHLEGPFISKEKAGAQSRRDAILPNEALFSKWQGLSGGRIRVVTLAPELEGAISFIKMLHKNNVIASLGHTEATSEEVQLAIDAGATQATHLFNAMRGMHQRNPGAAAALLLADGVTAELIADGIHLHPAMMDIAYRIKGRDHIVLVSDAIRAKCMGDGEYELGGQMVTVKDGRATLADGALAGSTLTLPQAIKRMAETTRANLEDAVHMATYVPARILQCEMRKGSIEVGKDADFTILNANFDVVYTMREGRECYNAL